MKSVNIRIPGELKERIDGHRPATVSREAWVRDACERALEAALVEPSGRTGETSRTRDVGGASPVSAPASPRTPRPARDVTTPEPVATGHATKQELDAARQAKLNANRKGSR